MRGSLSLFADVFEKPAPEASRKKGRSAELNARRNECLVDRYFFYGKYTDKRYSNIIEILSQEFFLSTVTIPEVISENVALLAKLKKEQPSKSFFSKKWTHLNW